ncbi:MAG: hypothetical protein KC549_04135 [Myxococcales bacterium]|nr:hypothetical protein [Myxococcales bacterium]MCB9549778.1 hypothetical protein [Myxococcales bacterium]
MIATVLLAALTLPDDVGAPPPGEVTIMAGFDRRPFVEVRTGLLDWLGLRLEGEVAEAPRVGGELRVAAGDGRGGLAAHTWLRTHLRIGDDDDVISGADLAAGVGVVGHAGGAFLRFDGGLVYGIKIAPLHADELPRAAVDQQGGLFFTQELTAGYDFGQRLRLDVFLEASVPSNVLVSDPTDEDVVRETDARIGARVGVRF